MLCQGHVVHNSLQNHRVRAMASASKGLCCRCIGARSVGAFNRTRLSTSKAGTTLQGAEVERRKQWQVSSHGRVCNTRGRIFYGHLRGSGYYKVNVLGNDFFVHRLVAFAFLGPPPADNMWRVHHRDGNPSNNQVQNLEYVTQSQNMKKSFAKQRGTVGPYLSLPVRWRVVGSQSWTTSSSMSAAATQLGMNSGTISKACRQGTPAKGYDFQIATRRGEVAALEAEEWRHMLDPMFGGEVCGRMVSSLGRIRSQNGIVSRGSRTKQGYHVTSLTRERRTEYVHRLVALAFLGQPENVNRHQVNHKDLDKGNNAVQNLEHVTPAENMAHRYASSDTRPRSDAKPVESRCCGRSDEWRLHVSTKSAADALGVSPTNIYHCLAHRRRHTGGFEFRLAKAAEIKHLPGEQWRNMGAELVETLRASTETNMVRRNQRGSTFLVSVGLVSGVSERVKVVTTVWS